MLGDIVKAKAAALKIFFYISHGHIIYLIMVVFHRRIQFSVGHDTELFDPAYKLLIGPEGRKILA